VEAPHRLGDESGPHTTVTSKAVYVICGASWTIMGLNPRAARAADGIVECLPRVLSRFTRRVGGQAAAPDEELPEDVMPEADVIGQEPETVRDVRIPKDHQVVDESQRLRFEPNLVARMSVQQARAHLLKDSVYCERLLECVTVVVRVSTRPAFFRFLRTPGGERILDVVILKVEVARRSDGANLG
jgi:hypothetical protein